VPVGRLCFQNISHFRDEFPVHVRLKVEQKVQRLWQHTAGVLRRLPVLMLMNEPALDLLTYHLLYHPVPEIWVGNHIHDRIEHRACQDFSNSYSQNSTLSLLLGKNMRKNPFRSSSQVYLLILFREC
jgi:hypothetical protein